MSEPRLNTIVDMQGVGLYAGHINAGLNESYFDRGDNLDDLAPIGPFKVQNDAGSCTGIAGSANGCYIAYCGEYGVEVAQLA